MTSHLRLNPFHKSGLILLQVTVFQANPCARSWLIWLIDLVNTEVYMVLKSVII